LHLSQHKLLSAFLTADGGLFERGLGHADNERTFADGFAAARAGFVALGFFFASFRCCNTGYGYRLGAVDEDFGELFDVLLVALAGVLSKCCQREAVVGYLLDHEAELFRCRFEFTVVVLAPAAIVNFALEVERVRRFVKECLDDVGGAAVEMFGDDHDFVIAGVATGFVSPAQRREVSEDGQVAALAGGREQHYARHARMMDADAAPDTGQGFDEHDALPFVHDASSLIPSR